MSTLVVILRIVSLLGFAGPMLLNAAGRRAVPASRAPRSAIGRAPLSANLAASGLHLLSLLLFTGGRAGKAALLLAVSGSLVALAGAVVVVRSRAALGSAWSLVPMADQATGLVTSGPYRLVRHPIYLGLALVTTGQALAFASWPALLVVLTGIVPTFFWRASAEEKLLSRTFGERYADYRRRTRRIVPGLL